MAYFSRCSRGFVFVFLTVAVLICGSLSAQAQIPAVSLIPEITTVAGNGTQSYSGDGGPATSAEFYFPEAVAVDSAGNLYIADHLNHRIRKIMGATGTITTVAGNGPQGYGGDNGPATSAQLDSPWGITLDLAGNLYIVDQMNQRIRMVSAATGIITTVAGNGATGYSGDNGPATSAGLYYPYGIAVDSAGNLYIAEYDSRVRKVSAATGIITTVAGNGATGYSGDNGPATSAELAIPVAVAVDSAGNLFISDNGNGTIRKVSAASGVITTVAGTGTYGYNGDNGPATNAQLYAPLGITIDSAANLYIADESNQRIRMVSAATGVITTVAGNGPPGYAGDRGPATAAELNFPTAIAVDSAGNLYITDPGSSRIRKVSGATAPVAFLQTSVGSATAPQNVLLAINSSLAISSISVPQSQGGAQEFTIGNVAGCVADGVTLNAAGSICTVPVTFQPGYPGLRPAPLQAQTSAGIFQVGLEGIGQGPQVALRPGVTTTVAGNGTAGYSGDNISAAGAQLNNPYSVAVDAAGNFYIADSRNNRIRKVTPGGLITTVAGNGNPGYSGDNGPATAAELRWPSGVALDSAGNLYIADYGNSRIRMVTAATGIITTVAGNGTFGYNGDNIAATSAELGGPAGLRLDAAGNLYIADQFNNRIRKVTAASGIITTVAGNGYGGGTGDCGGGYNGDNIAASSAELYCPADVALDGAGNLYIADYGNHRIRMVAAATSIITTVAGNGVYGFSGDGGPATSTQLFYPEGVALDAAGNLYIADSANYRLRMVTAATGIITTVAGNGTQGYSGDNGPANNAELDYPAAVVLDPAGNLYIADINNQRIRAVSVTTLPLGFAPTQINSNSATQTFRLANIGNAPLNLNGITPSPNFTGDASATTCSTSSALAAGDSCAVGVMFSPTTIGSFSGTLTLTDNALNLVGSTQQVNLAGIGTETTTVTFQPISPVNPAYGQTVSISVNVAAQSGLDAPSTGSVTFTVDGNQQPAIPLGTNGAVGLQLSGLKAGLHQVSANYGGSTDGNSLPSSNATSFTIAPAAPIITWASPATLTLGAALSSTQLNATSNVAGTFAYSPVSGTVLSAGLQTLSVTFTPTDVSDYKTAKAQVSLTVAGVAVSSPLPNSTVSSPVQLIASATPSSPVAKIKAMKVYVDNTVKYTADAASINTKLKLSKGSHHVTVQAWDALGTIYKDALVITVR